jgi:hypothetical protein
MPSMLIGFVLFIIGLILRLGFDDPHQFDPAFNNHSVGVVLAFVGAAVMLLALIMGGSWRSWRR